MYERKEKGVCHTTRNHRRKKKQKSDFLCSIAAEPVLENWVEGKHRYIYRSMNVVGG